MKSLLQIFLYLVLVLLLPQSALAIREICGDGIDNDSTGGDLLCPAPDQDHDGFNSSGGGYFTGTDCDDTNRYDYPGMLVISGCSAGQAKMCQTDGTYSACTSVNSIHTLYSGGTSTTVISSTVSATTCTGSGTYASPKGLFCFSDSSLSGYVAPAAGTVFILIADGTYSSSSWSDAGTLRKLFVNNKDGTLTNPIYYVSDNFAVVPNGSSSPTEIDTFYIANSSYNYVFGLSLTGPGYATGAIHYFDSPNGKVENNKVLQLNGAVGTNNVSCIKIRGASTGTIVDHNLSSNCYAALGPTNENNYGILFMDSDFPVARYNLVYSDVAGGSGHMMAVKHGVVGGGPGAFDGNYVYGSYIADIVFEQPQMSVKYNYIDASMHGGESIDQRFLGAHPDFDRAEVSYNTIWKGPAFNLVPDPTYNVRATVLNYHHNVVIDDRATSYGLGASDGFWRIYEYGSDASFTDVITGGKVSMHDNCYFNTANSNVLGFVVYGDNSVTSLGSFYSTFAAVQAAGFEANSYSEDPGLDVYNHATSVNCADKGHLAEVVNSYVVGSGKPRVKRGAWRYK